MESETNAHIGFECSFTQRVWTKIEVKLRCLNFWYDSSLLECAKNWVLKADSRYRSLPVIVSWFIWKARNLCYFEDIQPKTFLVSSLVLGLLNSYPMDNRVMNIRMVVNEHIDKSCPWAYFDGSAAEDPQICGAGDILFLTDGHFFTFSAGLGQGTNNYAELLALKLLILLSLQQGVHSM